MSVAFSSARASRGGRVEVTQQTIQKMLDENHHLIQCIMDYQSKGKTAECTQYQQILHRNLVYLATIADSNQNMQSLLPAPPSPSMATAPGGLGQGGGHAAGNLNDTMAPGPTPTSMMQSQLSNGPGHAPTQQQQQQHHQSGQVQASVSLPASGSYGGSAYSHAAPSFQGSMIQGLVPGYGSSSSSSSSPRSNLNMQSNQVSVMHQQSTTPHYPSAQAGGQLYQGQQAVVMMGQGSQGNSMTSPRPIGSYRPSQLAAPCPVMSFEDEAHSSYKKNVILFPGQRAMVGHGEYSYPQSSYAEQSYDRSFDESSQHYYEGGNTGSIFGAYFPAALSHPLVQLTHACKPPGNSQYSQQQQYQQSSGQQQQQQQTTFSQQQFSSQQGYTGQPPGYGSKRNLSTIHTDTKHTMSKYTEWRRRCRSPDPEVLCLRTGSVRKLSAIKTYIVSLLEARK
ncbi:putative calcium-responsive transactivator-like [Scophthalmus maximus]|uniref:Putative calcium-responsive transactivator-like n=1 Tax=Scophthalmus maximus TaxID=52904 RepID=A0A2U9C0U2_SCOMX|nr:putative calcium-responsive transactivator-like [Scophthalmus maximus]